MTTLTAPPDVERAPAAPPARPGPTPVPAPDGGLRWHRLLSLLAVLSLFAAAFGAWGSPVEAPVTGVLVAIVFGAGLAIATLVVCARSERALERADLLVLALGLLALAGQAINALHQNPAYGTDEAAFEQAAATLLLHGHDPYGPSLLGALSHFRVPIQYATMTLNGGTVSTFGYPPVSLLVTAAAVWLTGGTQAVPIADVVVLAIAAIAMFWLLPRPMRALAVLATVGIPLLFGFAASGVNAIVCMTLLLPVAHRWSSIGASGRLTAGQRATGVALGLAVATQQLAWFMAPFVLVAVLLLRRDQLGTRRGLRLVTAFAAWAAGAFVVVDLPFILWNPAAWLHGVAAPLSQHAIPYGQGLIDLTLFLHVGGGNLAAFDHAAVLLLFGLLAVFVVHFRRLARAAFVLPVIPLFISSRSLAEYFMTLAAVMVLSVASVEPASLVIRARRRPLAADVRALLTAACLAPALICLILALVARPPLTLRVVSFRTTGQLQSIWHLQVAVDNHSGSALTPRFAANSIGQATTFWSITRGPRTLAPGASATYALTAPNIGSMPAISSSLTLEAFTQQPATFSSTGLITPEPYLAVIDPGFVDAPLRRGRETTIGVQLRSPLGAPIRTAGVRVALGQIVYAQGGLSYAEARINGSPQGQTPVFAVTDASGRALFQVTDAHPGRQPVYFQSWVQPIGHYPFGYSDMLSVLWR